MYYTHGYKKTRKYSLQFIEKINIARMTQSRECDTSPPKGKARKSLRQKDRLPTELWKADGLSARADDATLNFIQGKLSGNGQRRIAFPLCAFFMVFDDCRYIFWLCEFILGGMYHGEEDPPL